MTLTQLFQNVLKHRCRIILATLTFTIAKSRRFAAAHAV
jgi:hypothetical protein